MKKHKKKFAVRVICLTIALTVFLPSGPLNIMRAFIDSGLADYIAGCTERFTKYINANTAHADTNVSGGSAISYNPTQGTVNNGSTSNEDMTNLINSVSEGLGQILDADVIKNANSLSELKEAIEESNQKVIDSNEGVAAAQQAVAAAQQAVAAAQQAVASSNNRLADSNFAIAAANQNIADSNKILSGAIDFLTEAVGHNTDALDALLKYFQGKNGKDLFFYLEMTHKYERMISDNILGYTYFDLDDKSGEVIEQPGIRYSFAQDETRTVAKDFKILNETLFYNLGYYVLDENNDVVLTGSLAEDLDTIISLLSHEYRVAIVKSYNAQDNAVLWKPYSEDIPYLKETCETSGGGHAAVYLGYWDADNVRATRYSREGNNRYYEILGDDALVRYDSLTTTYDPDKPPTSKYYSEVAGLQDNATWSDAIRLVYRALGKEIITTTFVTVTDDSITPENYPAIAGLSNPGELDGRRITVFASRSNYAKEDENTGQITYKDYYLAQALVDGCLPQSLTWETAQENITARDVWLIAARLMHLYGEPIMSRSEILQLLQVYGTQYPVEYGEAYANAWAYLKARGCLDMTVNPTDEVSLEYLLDVCMRIADKDSRLDYKTVNIVVSLDEAVIDTGFYPIDNVGISGSHGTSIVYNYGNAEYIDTFLQGFDPEGKNIVVYGVLSDNSHELLVFDADRPAFAWESYSGVDAPELTDCFIIKVALLDLENYDESVGLDSCRTDIDKYKEFLVCDDSDAKVLCVIPQESLGGIVTVEDNGYVKSHVNFGTHLYPYTDQERHPIDWSVASSTASGLQRMSLFFKYVFTPVKVRAANGPTAHIGQFSCKYEFTSFSCFSALLTVMLADSTSNGWEAPPSNDPYIISSGSNAGKTFRRVDLLNYNFLDIDSTKTTSGDPNVTQGSLGNGSQAYSRWTDVFMFKEPPAGKNIKQELDSNLVNKYCKNGNLDDSKSSVNTLLNALKSTIKYTAPLSVTDSWRGALNNNGNGKSSNWHILFTLDNYEGFYDCNVSALASYLKNRTLWLSDSATDTKVTEFNETSFIGKYEKIINQSSAQYIDPNSMMPLTDMERSAWAKVLDISCKEITCANGLKGVEATFYFNTDKNMEAFISAMDNPTLLGNPMQNQVDPDADPQQTISNKLLQNNSYAPALSNLSGDVYVSWSLLKDYADVPGDYILKNDMLSFYVKGHGQINIDKKNNTCLVNTILIKMDANTPLFLIDTGTDPNKPEVYIHYRCLVGIDPEKVILSVDPNGSTTAAAEKTVTLTDGSQRTLKIGTTVLNSTTTKSSTGTVVYVDIENLKQNNPTYTELTGISSYLGTSYRAGQLLQMMSTFPTANWVISSPNASTFGQVYVYYPKDLFDGNTSYDVDKEFIDYWRVDGKDTMKSMESAQFIFQNSVITIKDYLLTKVFNVVDLSNLTQLQLVTYYNLVLMYNDWNTVTFSDKYYVRSFDIESEDTFLTSQLPENEGKMFFSQYIGYFYVTPQNFTIEDYRSGTYWLPLQLSAGKVTSYNINSYGLVNSDTGASFKIPYGYTLVASADSDQYTLAKCFDGYETPLTTVGLTWIDNFGEEGNAIAAPAGIANMILNQGIYSTTYVGNLTSSAMRQVAFYIGSRRLYYSDSDTSNGIPFTFLEGSKTYLAIDSNTGLIHVTNDSRGKHHYVFLPTLNTISGAYQDIALSEFEISTYNPIYQKFENFLMDLNDVTNVALYILFYIVPYIMYVWIIILIVMALIPQGITKSINNITGFDLVHILTAGRRSSEDWRGHRVVIGLVVAFIATGLFYGPNLLKIIEIVCDWAYALSGLK